MTKWLVGLLLAAPLMGQQVMKLSLEQAVDLALAPNGALRFQMAQELTKQAGAQKKTALSALLPNVDGSYTVRSFTNNLEAFGLQIRSAAIPFQIPPFVGPIDTYDWRATATLSVFDWSAWSRYRASGARMKAATLEQEAQRNQTVADVVRAYTAAQRTQQMVKTARANVALAERVERLARSQKEAGTGTGIDIVRAQVQVAQELQRLTSAEEENMQAGLMLLRSMNLPLETKLELTDALAYQPVADVPVDKAMDAARERRAELKAQGERERASRLGYDAAKWERLPSVQAFGDYGVLGTDPASGLPTRSVGLRVNLPVFDGGRRDARRAESASMLRQEQIRSRDVAQQVEMEVRLAVEGMKTAEQQVKVSMEGLALAEKELEQAERRYEAGVAPSLEVTDAQTRVARAREQNVTALFRHRSAKVELNVATGARADEGGWQ